MCGGLNAVRGQFAQHQPRFNDYWEVNSGIAKSRVNMREGEQMRGRRKNTQANGGIAVVTEVPPRTLPENGSSGKAQPNYQFRRRGPRAANNKARALLGGQGALPPHKTALLGSTGRLLCHLENVSNRLFVDGEFRADGEPKLALSKLMELDRQIADNLRYLFDGDGADPDDPLSALMRREG